MKWADGGSALSGVDVSGPADAPTIVFVHGAVFQRSMWAPQREALTDEYQVVTFDLPGHGDRTDRDFDMNEALDVLGDVFEVQADGPAVLVGLSLGGYVATAYAYHYPEDVAGLVLSGSSANPVGMLDPLARAVGGLTRLMTRSDRIEGKIEDLAARWVRRRDIPPAQQEEIIDAGFAPRQFGVAGPYLAGTDFRAAFAEYEGPSLILNGEGDLLNRLGQGDHADAGAQARVEVIQDSGHTCNLGRPRTYTDAIRRFSRRALPDRAPGVEQ